MVRKRRQQPQQFASTGFSEEGPCNGKPRKLKGTRALVRWAPSGQLLSIPAQQKDLPMSSPSVWATMKEALCATDHDCAGRDGCPDGGHEPSRLLPRRRDAALAAVGRGGGGISLRFLLLVLLRMRLEQLLLGIGRRGKDASARLQ